MKKRWLLLLAVVLWKENIRGGKKEKLRNANCILKKSRFVELKANKHFPLEFMKLKNANQLGFLDLK